MSKLRRPTRQTQKSGMYAYCVVEDIRYGFATIKLVGDGPRLTNLSVVGGTVSVGDTAIVDYSAGTPPVVRPVTVEATEEELGLSEVNADEIEAIAIPSDVTLYAYGVDQTLVPPNTWTNLTWSNTKFDTGPYMYSGEVLMPFYGYYYVIAHVALSGFPDHRTGETVDLQASSADRIFVELVGSNYGSFAYELGFPIDTQPEIPVVIECSGFISAIQGEVVTVRVQHESSTAVSLVDNGMLYPRVMAFRMSRGGISEELTILNTQTSPGNPSTGQPPGPQYVPDDADIEIRTNQGYLHVTNNDQSYARASASVTDTSDAEVTLDFRFNNTDSRAAFRVCLRASRDWADWQTPTKAYELMYENTGTVSLYRIENGVRTAIGGTSRNPTTLAQKLRFHCNGSNIRARIWYASESEPGTWTLDVNDTGGFTTAGTLQLGYFRQINGPHKLYIDNVSVHAP